MSKRKFAAESIMSPCCGVSSALGGSTAVPTPSCAAGLGPVDGSSAVWVAGAELMLVPAALTLVSQAGDTWCAEVDALSSLGQLGSEAGEGGGNRSPYSTGPGLDGGADIVRLLITWERSCGVSGGASMAQIGS